MLKTGTASKLWGVHSKLELTTALGFCILNGTDFGPYDAAGASILVSHQHSSLFISCTSHGLLLQHGPSARYHRQDQHVIEAASVKRQAMKMYTEFQACAHPHV